MVLCPNWTVSVYPRMSKGVEWCRRSLDLQRPGCQRPGASELSTKWELRLSDHAFRHPEKFGVLWFREWIRERFPNGWEGFVAEDLDLVIRTFGSNYGSDDTGRFMLLEVKFRNATIGKAQGRTFGLIHGLLRSADPNRERYIGFYKLGYGDGDDGSRPFWLNGKPITEDELIEFLNFRRLDIEGMWE